MIHYHAIGWDAVGDIVRWLAGRHALVSYPVARFIDHIAPIVESFVIDNGAYSAWNKGEAYDFAGYVDLCYKWHRHPAFDWALIPDVIDGSEVDNDVLLDDWPADIRGVPVWHMHESTDRLIRLCSNYDYVALGSSGMWSHPGSKRWWHRMAQVMDAICDVEGRPPCRLHGLRMMQSSIVVRLPLSSADSSTASQSSRNTETNAKAAQAVHGISDKRIRAEILALRAEAFQSPPVWKRIDQFDLFRLANGESRVEISLTEVKA